MPLFDSYLMVDWSAANAPRLGRDSIWIAHAERHGSRVDFLWNRNVGTRRAAADLIEAVMDACIKNGRRLIAGFDFAFGYPAGAAMKMAGKADWASLWATLADRIVDEGDNRSNRYDVAAEFNRDKLGGFFFWGHPHQHRYDGLSITKTGAVFGAIGERRIVERHVKSAKSVWQLAYNGSVGSQTLLGIATLERLRGNGRLAPHLAIWPFETRFAERLDKQVTVAEIYPSLFPHVRAAGEVRDAAQVRTVATGFAERDAADALLPLLSKPNSMDEHEAATVLSEEGWIVGAGKAAEEPAARHGAMLDYLREPEEIYRQSFAAIERETNFSRIPKDLRGVAVRLIHACGMVDLVDDFAFSRGARKAGIDALRSGAPVLCDVEMVRHGVIRSLLPHDNDVVCLLNEDSVRGIAERLCTTRSAAQVDLWGERLGGAVVAIGNAPTALFRLLELVDAGAPKPALIVGMPVGFVGAAESKAELAAGRRNIEFLTIKGRRGGSAMAAAAINALAMEARQ